MPKPARGISKKFHTITPAIIVKGADKAIDFYKKAFGAEEVMRMPGPDGKSIMHAELTIGDSLFFVADEFPEMGMRSPRSLGGVTGSLHIYVQDADAAVKRAVDAGAKASMPVSDAFWGDRYGKVDDPFGHSWGLATPKWELTPEELCEATQKFYAEMAQRKPA